MDRHYLERAFAVDTPAQRVLFGDGALARIGDELDALGLRRVLVLCTPPQRALAHDVAGRLGERAAGVYDGAVMHVPLETARAGRERAALAGADGLVAVGGGSTIGLAKAIALDSGLPIVALPTTYAGSEMTPIWGLTEDGVKRTGRDIRVLPRSVVYDPVLTRELPLAMSMASGLNAIAHAAEALYAADANPLTDWMATEGLASLGAALPTLRRAPHDAEARRQALYGAWLCGRVLGSVEMGLHHKLCHTLGGSFDLPHAEVHSVVLAHALAYNASAAPRAMRLIATALRGTPADDGPQAVHELARDAGVPTSLRELGLPESALDTACSLALQRRYPNPRPLEAAPMRALLQAAWEGRAPT